MANQLHARAGAAAAVLAILGLFFWFAGDGLKAYFTPDDMMNAYGAWSSSVWTQDRPVGALVYRGLLAGFGLNPAPYRAFAFALLLANLGLLYAFCRTLSSPGAAALACLLGAYHAHLADLYYSTGTIYDLLCYFFYFSVFVWYARMRAKCVIPGWGRNGALLGLYLLALGSKEIAATLPLGVIAYELIYHRGEGRARWQFVFASVPLTVAYALYKTTGANSMAANPDYAPHFTVDAFLNGWKHYLGDLFYGAVSWNDFRVGALFAGMLGAAILFRRREMLFAWCFVLASALPVVLIQPRGFFALYITLPGWYLFAGCALARLPGLLRARPEAARAAHAAVFVLVLALLVPLHHRQKPRGDSWAPEAHATVRGVIEGLRAVKKPMPRGARVLILSDPYPADEWMLTFIFRLYFRDNEIVVHRAKVFPEQAREPARSEYQRFFVVEGGWLREVSSGLRSGRLPRRRSDAEFLADIFDRDPVRAASGGFQHALYRLQQRLAA